MIIKVYSSRKPCYFIMFDNVENLSVKMEQKNYIKDIHATYFYLDEICKEHPDDHKFEYSFITFTNKEDGTTQSVAFDNIAYICNNEGKTIEKVKGFVG